MLFFRSSRAGSSFSLIVLAVLALAAIGTHTSAAPVDIGEYFGTVSFPFDIDSTPHNSQLLVLLSDHQADALTKVVVEVVARTLDGLPIASKDVNTNKAHLSHTTGTGILQPSGSAQLFFLPNNNHYVTSWEVSLPTYLSGKKAVSGDILINPEPLNLASNVASSCRAFVHSGKDSQSSTFIPRPLNAEEFLKFMEIIHEVHPG
ncbi:hypothetical protein C8R42DRAFT_649466 [Lentinula raphanica]|nr:hypothetical protein C8R42DRAFT_649466 [Lentinula raphanica]